MLALKLLLTPLLALFDGSTSVHRPSSGIRKPGFRSARPAGRPRPAAKLSV